MPQPPPIDRALITQTLRAMRTPRLPAPAPGRRIVVLGVSGCGKSTLARILAARLDLDRIELDAEHWLRGWRARPRDELRARIIQRLDQADATCDGWVVDGNYESLVGDLVWPRAETLVWLDYPLTRTLWQVTTRTARRVLTREPLFGGENRESLRIALSRNSIIRWSLATWATRRLSYTEHLREPPHGLQLVQLRSRAETERWLAARVPASPPAND